MAFLKQKSERKHGLPTEPFPVSAYQGYIGCSKNLKDLKDLKDLKKPKGPKGPQTFNLAHKKKTSPQDPHRTLGISLWKGPRGLRFLMSEVLL